MEKEIYGYIYKITNIKNGKVYIGLTTNSFNRRYPANGEGIERVYGYYIKQRKNGQFYNKHLLRSIEKYGFEAFEVIKEFDTAYSEEELKEKERYWIAFYKCNDKNYGYNRTEGGDSMPSGEKSYWYGKHHSEETRKRISERMKGENHPFYGKHLSEETKRKQSERMKGENNPFYGKHHSEEHKNRMKGNKNSAKSIICVFPSGKIIKDVCMKELAKELEVTREFVRKILKSKQPYEVPKTIKKSDYERLKRLEGIIIMEEKDYLDTLKNINKNDNKAS